MMALVECMLPRRVSSTWRMHHLQLGSGAVAADDGYRRKRRGPWKRRDRNTIAGVPVACQQP